MVKDLAGCCRGQEESEEVFSLFPYTSPLVLNESLKTPLEEFIKNILLDFLVQKILNQET